MRVSLLPLKRLHPADASVSPAERRWIGKGRLFVLVCLLAMQSCAHTPPHPTDPTTTNGSFLQSYIDIYRGPLNHLRPLRRGACPMYPSCSEYSRQALARFGFAKGWVMTMDRLMRCGRDETRTAPKIWVQGGWKYYDPLENNALSPDREQS